MKFSIGFRSGAKIAARECAQMKQLIVVLFALSIAACSNPQDKVIPTDMSKWETDLKPSVEKLGEEDKKVFTAYLMRAKLGETFGGKKMPDGITIGKAIEEQKRWADEQAKREAEAKALKEKLEQERATLRKQVDEMLTVTVVQLKLEKGSFESGNIIDRQLIKLGFQNKGTKDIMGIKGEVKFIDIFDKEVASVLFSYDGGLKAGTSSTWTGSRNYNQFLQEHKALANLKEGKYKTRFEPEIIVFADGSKLVVKE